MESVSIGRPLNSIDVDGERETGKPDRYSKTEKFSDSEDFASRFRLAFVAATIGGWGTIGDGRDTRQRETAGSRFVVGGNSLQSTRSAFNNALPCTLGDLEREPITGEWNRMVFVVSALSSP